MKQLLSASERAASEELTRRKEASQQVVRLTEMKALLQQQLEEGGANSILEKQVGGGVTLGRGGGVDLAGREGRRETRGKRRESLLVKLCLRKRRQQMASN